MVAATGHRICNDCMKSCIYQKQEPVNIPQAETRTLKDVLELPWGFEIYSLLTRWNPLDLRRPYPAAARAASACWWSGMGPAGFTLAHHLMNDGHPVVGIDGLKIEPLPAGAVRRRRARAARAVPADPRRASRCTSRSTTASWRASAAWPSTASRCAGTRTSSSSSACCSSGAAQFAMFGGVRFGGTLSAEDAFALGFDHVALAAGAGRPDRARAAQRPRARRAHRLGLPDGAAAHRRGQDRLGRQPADPPAGRGDRRRPDRDRHRHRVARLLPAAGGEVPGALRDAGGGARRGGGAQRLERGRERDRRRVPRARACAARRAGRGGEGRPARAHRRAAAVLGRGHHRLPQAAHRQPLLHAQPRGSGEGARGRHPLRRGPDPAGRGGRRASAMPAACASRCSSPTRTASCSRPAERCCRRARSWSPPARSPTRCWRARTRRISRSTAATSRPATRTAIRSSRSAAPSREHVRGAAGARAGRALHQLLRRPASVLLRQRREGDGRRQAGLPGGQPRARAHARAGIGAVRCAVRRAAQRRAARHACTRWCGSRPPSSKSSCARRRRAPFPARPVLSPAELRAQRARRRRHAPGHGRPGADRRLGRSRSAGWSRPSCSRWAARPTCARCSSPASRWC